jgi:hypothetical protein
MHGQQKERWKELCELAAREQKPERLMEFVAEMNGFRTEGRGTDCGAQSIGRFTVVIQLPNSIPSARSLSHGAKNEDPHS